MNQSYLSHYVLYGNFLLLHERVYIHFQHALLNGKKVATNPDWQKATQRDLTDMVKVGRNVLTIKGKNEGGAAGLVARLSLKQKNGKVTWVESGGNWEAQAEGSTSWKPATVIAKYGAAPWGKALDGGGGGSAPGPVAGGQAGTGGGAR